MRTLSGGQQRRLDVGLALIGDPELIFLDEPTTGFDPTARRNAWELIAGLRDLGVTVFLTTHYMDEAQALADRVAIISGGEIVAVGPPGELGGRAEAAHRDLLRLPAGVRAEDLPWSRGRFDGAGGPSRDPPTSRFRCWHRLTGWALADNGTSSRGSRLPGRALRTSTSQLTDEENGK